MEGAGGAAVTGPNASASDRELQALLSGIEQVANPTLGAPEKAGILEGLSGLIRPRQSPAQGPRQSRQALIRAAAEKGAAEAAASCVDHADVELSGAAAAFLTNLAFDSDQGALAVLGVLDRAVGHFRQLFGDALTEDRVANLNIALLLCANVAAICPSSHPRLLPLARPACAIVAGASPPVDDTLRGNTILLLANLSLTAGKELRELGVPELLLCTALDSGISEVGKSVSESVVVILHEGSRCPAIDRLIEADLIAKYCVPLMEQTLRGEQFRGMYPVMIYSARIFWMLARTPRYAEALAGHGRAVSLLLETTRAREPRITSLRDAEGRLLALRALRALRAQGLWPPAGGEGAEGADQSAAFVREELPGLLEDPHRDVRAVAADIWAMVHVDFVYGLLAVGQRLQERGALPAAVWRQGVLAFLFPCAALATAARKGVDDVREV